MDPAKYIRLLIGELAQEFAPIERLRQFTTNSDLIGCHAESAVRAFIARSVMPLRVSTGTVIDEQNCGVNTPQFDVMLWAMRSSPPVFEKHGFAIVPKGSCLAILEVKSSAYSDAAGAKMRQTLDAADSLLERAEASLGVFCVQRRNLPRDCEELIREGRAVSLLVEQENTSMVPSHRGMAKLVNLLIKTRIAEQSLHGCWGVNESLL